MSTQTDQQRASDTRKVLPNRLTGQRIAGVSKVAIYAGGGTASMVWFGADMYVPPGYRSPFYLLAVSVFFGAVIASFHTPNHLSVHEHLRRLLVHHTRQHTMLSARNGSKKEQPQNETLPGRIVRWPIMRNIRGIGVDEEERSQDAVQVARPFHNSPVIETTDGGVIGAIKVRPAAMAVANEGHWKRRVERLANVIDSSVTARTQFTSKMRAVDYGDRMGTYDDREQELLDQLAAKHGDIDTAYRKARSGEIDREDLGLLVGADLADERKGVIDLYDVTTLKRNYYVTVKIEPADVVTEDNVEAGGGMANVPLLGRLWKHKELRDLRQEGDHTQVMVERLENKLETLESDLRTIEDISTRILSSTELSQVFADHYQAANAYANADFADVVRLSPKPTSSEGTAMYGVDHDHLQDLPSSPLGESSGMVEPEAPSNASPMADQDDDGGRHTVPAPGDQSDDHSNDDLVNTAKSAASSFADRVAEINDNPVADVILTKEQLIDHYQTVVGPKDGVYRGNENWITIDNTVYSKTLSIREWPAVPKMGILEPILREHEPGVAVNVATHINPIDQQRAEVNLADTEDQLQDKKEKAEDSRLPMFLQTYRKQHDEAKEMVQANQDSEYDLFETNTHIELRSDDPEALGRTIDHINSMMNDEGAEARQETAHHFEGWQSVAPACDDKLEEPIMMFADGVAREFPWTSRNLHEPNGVEFGINMHTNEPLYLDLWNRKTGFDFGIFTKKGGGKTTTATEILGRLNTVYRDDLMTIIIDPLQEYANLATVHDGERLVVGGDTGINPFHIEATPEEKLATIGKGAPYKHWLEGCMDFVEMYYADEGLDFAEKKGIWRMAIREAAERYGIEDDPVTHSADYRRQQGYSGDCPTPLDAIEIIDEMTEEPEEWVRSKPGQEPSERKVDEREKTAVDIINNDIQPFLPGGEYEHFTKQTNIDLEDSTFFYVDMQQQEASTSIGLTMQVVYDLFYEMVKTIDIPSIIFMDEFHYMLRDSLAQKSLNQKFRHGRHWDLSLGVATQSFKDFFGEDADGNTHLTDNAQVLFENMPTQIFHQEDMSDEWAEEIGLTSDEARFIRNAEPGNRELGYSTALLRVSDKGTYPLKVKMDFEENPREAVVTEFDPSEHGEDFYSYLLEHDDICEWRFAPTVDSEAAADTEITATGTNTAEDAVEQNQGPQRTDVSAMGDD
ncbi:VirB4 family type IV secretion system protein [Halalkalicoccus tibetensis]|uniref:VirB4 family type IV secretion system protein n=1 Tax=Halalkalicoccus tibetensis TaxID=175632 RepID=A0ABD5V6D2_9EURY